MPRTSNPCPPACGCKACTDRLTRWIAALPTHPILDDPFTKVRVDVRNNDPYPKVRPDDHKSGAFRQAPPRTVDTFDADFTALINRARGHRPDPEGDPT